MIMVTPRTNAKRLRRELPHLLAGLEATGIRQIGPRGKPVGDAARLGIVSANQSGTSFPGSIYLSIKQAPEQTGWLRARDGRRARGLVNRVDGEAERGYQPRQTPPVERRAAALLRPPSRVHDGAICGDRPPNAAERARANSSTSAAQWDNPRLGDEYVEHRRRVLLVGPKASGHGSPSSSEYAWSTACRCPGMGLASQPVGSPAPVGSRRPLVSGAQAA